MKQLAALALLLAGCLSVPDAQPVECKLTSDCDTANGEVCEEGVCWGNPPTGPFAVLLTPPSERKTDAVSRELIVDSLPADGYFGDLELGAPVTFTGQVVCPNECGQTELSATIVVTRPSSFAGGPAFRQVFETDPRTGGFQLVLPSVGDGESDYTITIIPDGRAGEDSLARLVPPLRTSLSIMKSESGKTIDLGSSAPLEITGSIVDANDNPATNYRVVAFGRWEANAPLTEVSTVDLINQTDNSFSIRLSDGLVGSVDLVAQPIGNADADVQPTLRMTINPMGTNLVEPILRQPQSAQAIEIVVDVRGTATGGEVGAVIGAHVTVRGQLAGATDATFVTTSDTDENGMATLRLPGGALESSYRVSVVPAANATVGMVFDRTLSPGGTTEIKLPDRLAIVGTVLDVSGNPLKDIQVTASPSLRFQWSLTPGPQAFATGIPAASVVTPDSGEFVLYVDPFIAAGDDTEEEFVWGFYDLSFVPSETTNAPLFTQAEVEIPRDPSLTQLSIGSLPLPDAAHIHGRIVAPSLETIEGAEIKLFRVEDPSAFTNFCGLLTNAPPSCPIPALQLGRGVSDVDGVARLTLPRL